MFKYLQLVTQLMYLCLNRLASKVWKKNCPNFLNTMYKAGRKSELSFSHSFLAVSPSLVMQQISSLILYTGLFFKKKNVAGFLQLGALYANNRHDCRSEFLGSK